MRSKNKYTSEIWYLFKKDTVKGTNEIETQIRTIGIPYQCDVQERTKSIFNPMTGNSMSAVVENHYTTTQLDFEIGDKVSNVKNPSQKDLGAIQGIKVKRPKRGTKRNNVVAVEYILEVS